MTTIHNGDCIEIMNQMPAESVDAIVTDPPYGLSNTDPGSVADTITKWAGGDRGHVPTGRGFMGKSWDAFVPPPAVWDECMRVLKPGGHMVVFAGSRTQDLMGLSIRLAGFEIRDSMAWLYGSGFPKSHNVSKSQIKEVDKIYGESRCDCVDPQDGRTDRDDLGREGRGEAGTAGGSRKAPEVEAGPTGSPTVTRSAADHLLELRGVDHAEAEGRREVAEAVLLPDVRGRGAEAPRHGDTSVRPGLEGSAGGDSGAGQGVSVLLEDAGAERAGATRAPSGAVPVRRDEPAGEPGDALRFVPSRDRGDHESGLGVDPGRREPRRVHLDSEGGRGNPVARVCSWCGLPDREWLTGAEQLGTALKPGHEPVVLARKPLAEKTVARNVLAYGTGAINVDACRIATDEDTGRAQGSDIRGGTWVSSTRKSSYVSVGSPAGRWPANVLLDQHAAAWVDEQSGVLKSGDLKPYRNASEAEFTQVHITERNVERKGDSGGASRFFYSAKAPKSERPNVDGVQHPTVKPLAIMRWLIRLVTPPGGVVLDPFAGSGTTIEAALIEGFQPVGIEMETDYLPLIQHRHRQAVRNTHRLTPLETPPSRAPPRPVAVVKAAGLTHAYRRRIAAHHHRLHADRMRTMHRCQEEAAEARRPIRGTRRDHARYRGRGCRARIHRNASHRRTGRDESPRLPTGKARNHRRGGLNDDW